MPTPPVTVNAPAAEKTFLYGKRVVTFMKNGDSVIVKMSETKRSAEDVIAGQVLYNGREPYSIDIPYHKLPMSVWVKIGGFLTNHFRK